MSAILELIRKFLSFLFGSSSPEEKPTDTSNQTSTEPEEKPTENIPPKEEETSSTDTEETEPEEAEEEATGPLLEVNLSRSSKGSFDIIGKLSVGGEECHTLESILGIPAGEYAIKFRKEGGRHATYWYKFGDIHKGMLWIKGVPNMPHVDIHIGNQHTDAQGGILVGTQVQNAEKADTAREVWYSEAAYEKIYAPIAAHLDGGGRVLLKISE